MEKKYTNTFGLYISNSVLTAVELDYGKAGLRVINYSRVELEPGVVEEDCIVVNPQLFKDAISTLMLDAKNGPITSRNVIISICEEKIFSHYLNIPNEERNNDEFIKDAARDYIPINLDDAIVDYKELTKQSNKDETTVNFLATQSNLVNALIKILNESNLNVVAIDTDKNSIIRTYENRFHTNEDGFIVVNIDTEKTTLNINTNTGISHGIDINMGNLQINNEIKQILNINTVEDVHNLLIKFSKNKNSITPENQSLIVKTLEDYFSSLIDKTNKLISTVKNHQTFELKTIYLSGCAICIPGMKEMLSKSFQNIEIKDKLEYIELDEDTELYYTKTIGLALRAALPENDDNDVNLLPKNKKYELYIENISPMIKRYLWGLCIIFGGLLMLTGILAAKTFTNFKISEQEAQLLTEKTLNPYLTEAAQAKQHKSQLESQMLSVLRNSIPGSQIMKKVDSYNQDNITMINNIYQIANEDTINMRIRAKTISREETENFIIKLETDSYYKDVISPLSNLAGKGERFINIDLTLNPDAIISDFGKQDEKVVDSKEEIIEVEENTDDQLNEATEEIEVTPKTPSIQTEANNEETNEE